MHKKDNRKEIQTCAEAALVDQSGFSRTLSHFHNMEEHRYE